VRSLTAYLGDDGGSGSNGRDVVRGEYEWAETVQKTTESFEALL